MNDNLLLILIFLILRCGLCMIVLVVFFIVLVFSTYLRPTGLCCRVAMWSDIRGMDCALGVLNLHPRRRVVCLWRQIVPAQQNINHGYGHLSLPVNPFKASASFGKLVFVEVRMWEKFL